MSICQNCKNCGPSIDIGNIDHAEEHLMSFILDTSASCKTTQVLNMIPDLQHESIQESDAKF